MEISVDKWNALSAKEQESILSGLDRKPKRAIVMCVCGHPKTDHRNGVCGSCECTGYKRGN